MSSLGDYTYSSDVDSRKATVPYQADAGLSTPQALKPVDLANQTDIEPSRASAVPNVYVSSQPGLRTSELSLYSNPTQAITGEQLSKLALQLSITYAETMQALLDNWKKQIERDAEISREQALKASIDEGNRRLERVRNSAIADNALKSEVERPTLHKAHLSGEAFIDYLRKASPGEKMRIIASLSGEFFEAGGSAPGSFRQMVEDSKKVTPYGMLPFVQAYLVEALIINPTAAELATRDLSSSALGKQMLPFSAMTLNGTPQINLMVPSMQLMYASAEDTALSLKNKFDKLNRMPGEEAIDEEFVNEFAKKTLDRVNNMDRWLPFRDIQQLLLSHDIRANVQRGAALIALTTVLIFDTKAQAAFSNLSPEEFQSLLAQGIPGNEQLNGVVDKIKSILREFAAKERVEYVAMLLDYIERASSMHLKDLKDFSSVLLRASEMIGTDVRGPIAAA